MDRRTVRDEFRARWARALWSFGAMAVVATVLPALLAGSATGGEPPAVQETAPAPVAPLPADEAFRGILERLLPQMFFEFELLDIALWQWIALLALALVTAIASWLLAMAIVSLVRPLVARTETIVDDRLLEGAAGPIRLVIALLVFRVGLIPLGLHGDAIGFISM